jgi:hypothetical protein
VKGKGGVEVLVEVVGNVISRVSSIYHSQRA